MNEPQHFQCTYMPSTTFPFTEGKIYRRVLGIGKLPTIKDDLGHERCIGNEFTFIVCNDGSVFDGTQRVLHARFEPVNPEDG